MSASTGPQRPHADQVEAMLDAAGYKGERIVLLHPSDHIYYNPASQMVAQQLKQCGFEYRRPGHGLGHRAVTTHEPRTARQRRLVGVLHRGTGARLSRSPARCLPSGLKRSAGRRMHGQEALYDTWLSTTDPAEQTRLEIEYRRERLSFCRSFHWDGICRRRPGGICEGDAEGSVRGFLEYREDVGL